MKATTTHALLLSLVVMAGVAATDAYAQSNTERITEMHGTMLPDIEDSVEDISEDTSAIQGIVEAIQAAITGLGEQMSEVAASVSEMTTSVNTVTTEVSEINSKISSFESTLDNIPVLNMRIGAMERTLASIDARTTTINEALTTMNTTLGELGTSNATAPPVAPSTDPDLSVEISQLSARLLAMSDRLDRIQVTLDQVADQTSGTDTPSDGRIRSGTSTAEINTYDYKSDGEKHTVDSKDYYELDMTFSCNKDVAIDSVELEIAFADDDEYLSHSSVTFADRDINFIMVDGRELFHNKFQYSSDTTMFTVINLDKLEFKNKRVDTDDNLLFRTQVYDARFTAAGAHSTTATDAPLIGNSNRTDGQHTELYTVSVNWISSEGNPGCSIRVGEGGAETTGLTSKLPLVYEASVEARDDGRTLRDFSDTIVCSDIAEITSVTTDTKVDERWDASLNNYATMRMTILNDGDTDVDATYRMLDTGLTVLIDGEDPQFDGRLMIDGRVPTAESLLVTINYESTANGECVHLEN